MVFKIENSQVVINGRSVLKALMVAYIVKKVCKAIRKSRKEYFVIVTTEIKDERKTKTNKKVESI